MIPYISNGAEFQLGCNHRVRLGLGTGTPLGASAHKSGDGGLPLTADGGRVFAAIGRCSGFNCPLPSRHIHSIGWV